MNDSIYLEGHRGTPSNPAATLTALGRKRVKLQDELRRIEKQVYDLETSYLQDSSRCGNVLKGFEGFRSSSKNTANLKRSSQRTGSSLCHQLLHLPVKPKKGGRTAPREGKKIRLSNDLDMKDDDDPT